jgi:hypothetical protein
MKQTILGESLPEVMCRTSMVDVSQCASRNYDDYWRWCVRSLRTVVSSVGAGVGGKLGNEFPSRSEARFSTSELL